jgi:phage/plasmid-like protein (TIGR03299 family)
MNECHQIDVSTGTAAIAFVGATPWHKLGQRLTADADIGTWTREAGLAWEVLRAPVQYAVGEQFELHTMLVRDVLYRGDTNQPLGVVGKNYHIVQPEQVMGFFDKLVRVGGFSLETAGALSDGKRIWALAKIGEGAPIIGQDHVMPYLLLSTSYDGTMATTAKLTTIRVVCNNTITAALYEPGTKNNGRGIATTVKVNHNAKFNADQVRKDLGIFTNSFDKWIIQTKMLAQQEINLDKAADMTAKLIAPTMKAQEGKVVDVTANKGYKRVMELFDGQAIGADMAGFTKWGWLNAVTQLVDHERGKDQGRRLNSAWFGDGDRMKSAAYQIAIEA